jgi:hypothetical protein
MPSKTELSETISAELKARGFRFVGPTTIYAFMQSVGIVNDHTRECFLFHGQPQPSDNDKGKDKEKESADAEGEKSESESDRRSKTSSRSKRLRSK